MVTIILLSKQGLEYMLALEYPALVIEKQGCYNATCYNATMLQCYNATMLQCYMLTTECTYKAK